MIREGGWSSNHQCLRLLDARLRGHDSAGGTCAEHLRLAL